MGKNKKDYNEEVESYSYGSESSIESGSSESSGSESSESESSSSSSEKERRRRHVKRKSSKVKKERRGRRSDEAEGEKDTEHDERRKRRKRRHDDAERYEDEYVIRGDERKHRSSSRKHKHHHRKHKHKHRHRKRHHSEERRRGGSRERSEGRRGRDGGEDRRYKERIEYGSVERERRGERDGERRNGKEDKRLREKFEGRQARSKWDEDEDAQYDSNKRIKVEPGQEDEEDRRRGSRSAEPRKTSTHVKREPGGGGRRGGEGVDRDQAEENVRPEWGLQAKSEGGGDSKKGKGDNEDRQKPNLGLTGKLSEDTNTYNGVIIKYSQPPEARKPKRRWRWYIFKGDEDLPFLPLHRQSAYLIGRDRKVADIPTDHPSCSKQHAVLQYRLVAYQREDGTKGRTVKPYILDLDSANGTFVNNRKIEPRRFVELLEKDVVKFGYSSREYILLHEGSKGDDDSLPDTGVELSPVSLLRS